MNHFKVKATSNEYRLIINQEASLNDIMEEMKDFTNQLVNIKRDKDSYNLIIDTPNRLLPNEMQDELKRLIKQRSNWDVKFRSNVLSQKDAIKWHKSTTLNVEFQTISGGEIIEVEGDILLIGDIEPGGYLRASGSIFIVGNIEGVVNAGYKGDKDAVIVGIFSSRSELKIDKSSYSINHLIDDKSSYTPRVYYLNDRQMIDVCSVSNIQKIRPHIDRVVSQLDFIEPRL